MQVPIEEYISELLYEHDCVVVPGFGGFIGNYAPARIDPVKHLFEPPGKNILLNKGLTQNDGLLANHISLRKNVSYKEALDYIAGEVKRIRTALQQDKRIALDSIGLVYTDEQGNLLFQPDEKINYLPDAFGLSAFYRLPAAESEREVKVIPLPAAGSRIRTWAAAAALGAVVTSAVWLSLNVALPRIDYSGLNLFAKKEARLYSTKLSQQERVLSYNNDSTSAIAFLSKNILTPDQTISAKGTQATSGDFLIITGCFRLLENAQSLVKKMQQEKVNASIIGTNPQGLYMVGSSSFSTRERAENQLETFRKNYVADAWVYTIPAAQRRN